MSVLAIFFVGALVGWLANNLLDRVLTDILLKVLTSKAGKAKVRLFVAEALAAYRAQTPPRQGQ